MLKIGMFLLLFVAANIKYFDLLFGLAKLHIWPAVALYTITYAMSYTFWLMFPYRSPYAD